MHQIHGLSWEISLINVYGSSSPSALNGSRSLLSCPVRVTGYVVGCDEENEDDLSRPNRCTHQISWSVVRRSPNSREEVTLRLGTSTQLVDLFR
ncbi:hypothetical protein WA026_003598 [Henosepilachna vigintioctopunctata]|uniref:Uncharacterized protein n=1 Tax=Henosepilachna vigintioctopunctata TaxID=420089 RepID=A0AAW1THQ5_9CUCU